MTNYFEQFIDESSKNLSREELMKELKKKYPSLWMKDSEDFDKGKTKNAIWTGSESHAVEKDGKPIFDYNANGSKYEFGIHIDLYNFLEKKGWYCEWYDSGTILIFQDDINESFKSDLKDFLEDELKYNEDSHVTDEDVDQIYHAFISKYKKYKLEKSIKIYDEIHDYFSVLEGKVELKRKYGTNPPHHVNSHAPMRERVLSFVKERGEVSEEEITEYVKGIREDVGKEGPSGWLKKNPEYFEKSGAKLILSKKGERFLASKKVNESSVLRFEDFINESSTIKSTGTMS